MGRTQRLVLAICLIITFGFYGFNRYKASEINALKKTILTQKDHVFDESQFIFKPIIEEIGDKKQLKILLEITSYMHPEILELNYQKQTMLEINEEFALPVDWHVIEKSKYKIIGQLIFKINESSLKNFGLKIFTYSDHEIIWD